jgi:HlyD family secretion protein
MSGASSPVIKLAAVLAAALAVSGAAVWSNPQLVERVRVAVSRGADWGNRQMATSRSPGPVSVTGTIEATQVDVSVKITGRIVERLVREGDVVKRGQLLVRLDSSELAADVHRQRAALRSAQATLRDLQKGARPQEIEDARSAVASAEATRVMTGREYQRNEKLFKQNLIAAQDVDRARQAYDVAQAQEKGSRERLALILSGSRPDQVEAASWQAEQAQHALAQAESRLREAAVYSPIDGVVLRKNLEAGETANPGVAILTLVNPKDIWLRAYVPESEVGRLKVGDPARLTIDAFSQRVFTGRVVEIASEAEFTPRNVQTKKERVNLVFRIKIQVDNPDGLLKPGLPADADVD